MQDTVRALTLLIALFCYLALSSASPGKDVAKRITSGSLQPVTNFGDNPSGTLMYIYVPNNLATKPGIVVAIHYCGWSTPNELIAKVVDNIQAPEPQKHTTPDSHMYSWLSSMGSSSSTLKVPIAVPAGMSAPNPL